MDTFAHSISVAASCSSVGFGYCAVNGAAISGLPPFNYVITQLTNGTLYYIRVAARNSLSSLTPDPTGKILDSTRWSSTVTVIPSNQLPGAPLQVTIAHIHIVGFIVVMILHRIFKILP